MDITRGGVFSFYRSLGGHFYSEKDYIGEPNLTNEPYLGEIVEFRLIPREYLNKEQRLGINTAELFLVLKPTY